MPLAQATPDDECDSGEDVYKRQDWWLWLSRRAAEMARQAVITVVAGTVCCQRHCDLEEIKILGEYYGLDLGRPATNEQEAVQWVYMAYLAAVKEQDGAAMSLDVYKRQLLHWLH